MTHDQNDVVEIYSGPLELAKVFQGELENAGITAKVVGTELAASFGSALPGSTELWVHQADFAKAKAIIDGESKSKPKRDREPPHFPRPTRRSPAPPPLDKKIGSIRTRTGDSPRGSSMRILSLCLFVLVLASIPNSARAAVPVDSAAKLVAAVRDGAEGDTIEIAAGRFELDSTLELKAKMTLKGAGLDKTILTHTKNWKPSTKTLPDPEMKLDGLDTDAYLIRIKRDTAGVTITGLTVRAPQLHGAIFAWFHIGLHVHHVKIQETLYSGIRTFGLQKAKIHDCEFVDAGGRWDNGKPGVKGGLTGGAIFSIWMSDTEISHNRFVRTRQGPAEEFYGIKGRQGQRCHIHHNTIETNFSIEFPFEGDEDNEIDHNVCHGTISIPKYAGGNVPKSGRTFRIHHNWLKDSYSIEFVRNGVEIDHNLFDFDVKNDGGNLISSFGDVAAKGPARFHNK